MWQFLCTAASATLKTTFLQGLLAGKEGVFSVLRISGRVICIITRSGCNRACCNQNQPSIEHFSTLGLPCRVGFILKERSWALYHYNQWKSGWEVNATVIVLSKNDKIFAWVWPSGLVNNDVEESKANFPFGSSLFFFGCNALLIFYPLEGRSEVLWAHLPKKLHSRKIYSEVTAAVFLWFHHLQSTKHFSFSRVPTPSQTWPNISIGCRNPAICKQ